MVDGTPWGLPRSDLDAFASTCETDLKSWKGSRILITGGTGFIGSWLTGSLLHANSLLGLNLKIVVISRDPSSVPLSENEHLSLVRANVRSLPQLGEFELIVHGAASSSAKFGVGDGEPRQMATTIIDGTRSIIELGAPTRARVLFLSSGAVYGPQTCPVGEAARTSPDPLDPASMYGESKRVAESLLASATASDDVDVVIARLFAFIGPRLPLQAHYAAGNFLNDALLGHPIDIQGDGRPFRSYLYAGDLPEWCWALITRGNSQTAYNVGSPDPLTIADLAQQIAGLADQALPVQIHGAPNEGPAPWYVPCTDRAHNELGLTPRVDLASGLRRWFDWCSHE